MRTPDKDLSYFIDLGLQQQREQSEAKYTENAPGCSGNCAACKCRDEGDAS